jgi:hypothetical protein
MKSTISRTKFDRLVENCSSAAGGLDNGRQVVKLEGRARVRNWRLANAVAQTASLLLRIVSCAGAEERLEYRARIRE